MCLEYLRMGLLRVAYGVNIFCCCCSIEFFHGIFVLCEFIRFGREQSNARWPLKIKTNCENDGWRWCRGKLKQKQEKMVPKCDAMWPSEHNNRVCLRSERYYICNWNVFEVNRMALTTVWLTQSHSSPVVRVHYTTHASISKWLNWTELRKKKEKKKWKKGENDRMD